MVRLFYFLLMLIVAPWATAGDGTNPTNFKAVDEELGIFRSGQPGRKEFESLAKRGLKSILNTELFMWTEAMQTQIIISRTEMQSQMR